MRVVSYTLSGILLSGQPEVKPRPAYLEEHELAAWRGMLRVHARLIRELSTELEQAHGLPLSSYEVLLVLSQSPGERLRMAELADAVVLSPSGITRLVDRLVGEGLVAKVRCVRDRRGWYAVLTDAGRDRLGEARGTHLAGVRARFHQLVTADEQAMLAGIWERLLQGGESEPELPTC
jgi:DNA-binding MarR family transcriptional regulator